MPRQPTRACGARQCLYPLDATDDVERFCCGSDDARVASLEALAPAPASPRLEADQLQVLEAMLMAPSAAPSPMMRPQHSGARVAPSVDPSPMLGGG